MALIKRKAADSTENNAKKAKTSAVPKMPLDLQRTAEPATLLSQAAQDKIEKAMKLKPAPGLSQSTSEKLSHNAKANQLLNANVNQEGSEDKLSRDARSSTDTGLEVNTEQSECEVCGLQGLFVGNTKCIECVEVEEAIKAVEMKDSTRGRTAPESSRRMSQLESAMITMTKTITALAGAKQTGAQTEKTDEAAAASTEVHIGNELVKVRKSMDNISDRVLVSLMQEYEDNYGHRVPDIRTPSNKMVTDILVQKHVTGHQFQELTTALSKIESRPVDAEISQLNLTKGGKLTAKPVRRVPVTNKEDWVKRWDLYSRALELTGVATLQATMRYKECVLRKLELYEPQSVIAAESEVRKRFLLDLANGSFASVDECLQCEHVPRWNEHLVEPLQAKMLERMQKEIEAIQKKRKVNGDSSSTQVCRHFLNGKCLRGATCKFSHEAPKDRNRYPSGLSIGGKWTVVCINHQKQQGCSRQDCKFEHVCCYCGSKSHAGHACPERK